MLNVGPSKIVIASRESRLALWQAEHIRDRLLKLYPACAVSILGMTTQGDRILDRPLAKIGGKGLFVKELELALESGAADIAVHSMKDVPMQLPAGFALTVVGEREDSRDAFVSNQFTSLAELPSGAIVGTSSLRRESQIKAHFPHLKIEALRGNVETRLRKLDEGLYAAIILAAAGLKRLELGHRITAYLSIEESLPAVGQGALGIEYRADRYDIGAYLAPFTSRETTAQILAERAFSRQLAGSCETPLGGHAIVTDGKLHLRGFVAATDGSEIVSGNMNGELESAEQLGEKLGNQLLEQGAAKILHKLSGNPSVVTNRLPLQGRSILITRPKQQAERLAQAIQIAGGEAILFPTIEIEPVTNITALHAITAQLPYYDIAIFVSANAVEQSMPYLSADRTYPATLRFAAIGAATKQALHHHGITNVLAPTERYDSEALLELPELQAVKNKRIMIFRGDGGRELIAETLRNRGATVDHAICYRRVRSHQDPNLLIARWHAGTIHAVSTMSRESLTNLYDILDPSTRQLFAFTPVFVPHARIADAAQALGCINVQITGASNEDLVKELSLV